jgi:hypothetical protein
MQREVIFSLPPYLQKELLDRMLSSGFSDYLELEEWLKGLGHEVSKSSCHRLGQRLEQYLSGTPVPPRLKILFWGLGYRPIEEIPPTQSGTFSN